MYARVCTSERKTDKERANRKREGEREKGGGEAGEENSTSSTVEFQEGKGWRRGTRACVSVSLHVYALTCAHVWVAESEGEGSWEGGAATVGRHLP